VPAGQDFDLQDETDSPNAASGNRAGWAPGLLQGARILPGVVDLGAPLAMDE
jgi:hypothetical protein